MTSILCGCIKRALNFLRLVSINVSCQPVRLQQRLLAYAKHKSITKKSAVLDVMQVLELGKARVEKTAEPKSQEFVQRKNAVSGAISVSL
jgi:hypothetical protein